MACDSVTAPGPRGKGYKTLTWGNMMVMSSRCQAPEVAEVAWEYIRLVCSLEGALLRLKRLRQNSPRLDFYRGDAWKKAVAERPYLANVPRICEVGDPLHHTQIHAVQDEVQWIYEYVLLNWPEIEGGTGRFEDAADALRLAAKRVTQVYRRYGEVVRGWQRGGTGPAKQGGQ